MRRNKKQAAGCRPLSVAAAARSHNRVFADNIAGRLSEQSRGFPFVVVLYLIPRTYAHTYTHTHRERESSGSSGGEDATTNYN